MFCNRWTATLGFVLLGTGVLSSQEPRRAGLGAPIGSGEPPPITPVAAQVRGLEDDSLPYLVQLTPPGPERLFRLESEHALRERIQHEAKAMKRKAIFPEGVEPYPVRELPLREWGTLITRVEPGYLCYDRVWYEQRNFERYGWSLGVLQPGVSAGLFLFDFATFPINLLRDPFRNYECTAGLCLPGDPTPLWLYWPAK